LVSFIIKKSCRLKLRHNNTSVSRCVIFFPKTINNLFILLSDGSSSTTNKGQQSYGKGREGKGKADPGIFDRLTENMNRSSGATKVVCLTQVVSADELKDDEEYEDIMEDMRLEGGKYGIYC